MDRRSFLTTAACLMGTGISPNLWSAGKSIKDESIKDYLFRIHNPDQKFGDDIVPDRKKADLLKSIDQRLRKVIRIVGYGNFNVLCFDDMLKYSRRYSQIGDFSRQELDYLEGIFYTDASLYGFYGEKPLPSITKKISDREIVKIPGTGHYLFAGEPVDLYQNLQKRIGDRLILTSGIRNIVKQMQLFVSKATRFDCNLSLASRSLAPPGYSFHGVGDFDVGIKGWGAKNFTDEFARTKEFAALNELGYIKMRYPVDNQLGVRFEPWHIKVS